MAPKPMTVSTTVRDMIKSRFHCEATEAAEFRCFGMAVT